VSGTLRIAASRVAQAMAADDDADPSTPTKMPRCTDDSAISLSPLGIAYRVWDNPMAYETATQVAG
jgi:hypothetical protein